jgi:hypothetical protein
MGDKKERASFSLRQERLKVAQQFIAGNQA